MKKTILGVGAVLVAGAAGAAESASGGGLSPELLQLITLMVNGVLLPLLGKVLAQLTNLERRLSYIEGKLRITERADR